MSTHVKVLAGLFLGFGALGAVAALFSSVAFGLLANWGGTSGDPDAALGRAIWGITGLALTTSLLLASAPAIICGWGLLKFRSWARILGIILGAVSLVAFPYGTVFGAYALWVLLSKQTEPVFEPKTTSGVVSK